MKLLAVGLMFVAAACAAGDDTYDGSRAQCAEGGELEACPPADQTPEAACWRLVDCAVIPVRNKAGNGYDWGQCVDDIESLTADRERAVIECIAASSCDSLKVDGSPSRPNVGELVCFQLGAD